MYTMINSNNRAFVFLFFCIGIRLFMAYIPQILPKKYFKVLASILMLIGLGFLRLFFTNGRFHAFEAGGKTWWAELRLIHAALLISAAIYLFRGSKTASVPLLIDAICGIVFYFTKRVKII